MDFDSTEILLIIENKLQISLNNNILIIELFEESLLEEDTNKMNNVLDTFYDNCKKNNIFFYILYDFSQLSITSSTNLIYNASIYQDHFDKNISVLRSNLKSLCVIITNYTLRESLISILDLYKPELKVNLIEKFEDTTKYFL